MKENDKRKWTRSLASLVLTVLMVCGNMIPTYAAVTSAGAESTGNAKAAQVSREKSETEAKEASGNSGNGNASRNASGSESGASNESNGSTASAKSEAALSSNSADSAASANTSSTSNASEANNNASKQDASDSKNQPKAETRKMAKLSSIIGKDEDGTAKCYVTVYDSQHRIVDTTDPKQEQNKYYRSKEGGGEGGTLNLGASLTVRFRMAEIQEHDGDKGVQEGTTYYMDLPDELVPMEKDSKGNKLVNPDTPVTFFRDGDVKCTGGIYVKENSDTDNPSGNADSTFGDADQNDDNDNAGSDVSAKNHYQLQMNFSDVEDQLDISGSFQYGVTVSNDLKYDTTYDAEFVPGGKITFTTTPEPVRPAPTVKDSMILNAGSSSKGNEYINWKLTLNDGDQKMKSQRIRVKMDEGTGFLANKAGSDSGDVAGVSSVKITYKDGDTETLSAMRIGNNTYGFYREKSGSSFKPSVTQEEGKDGIICTAYLDETDAYNDGSIVERSGDTSSEQCFLTRTLYIDLGALKSNKSNAGNSNGTENPGDLDLGIESYEFSFTTVVYDNYNIPGKGYTGKAILTDSDNYDSEILSAYNGKGIGFGVPANGHLSLSPVQSDKNYEGYPAYIDTSFQAHNSQYNGNYYSLEFTPQHEFWSSGRYEYRNTTGANYYTNMAGFHTRDRALTGSHGTFNHFQIGSTTEWEFKGTFSYSDVQAGVKAHFSTVMNQTDLVLQYQMKQIFKNMNQSDQLMLYRSKEKVNGKYIYVFIDPNTYNNANKVTKCGWYQNVQMDDKDPSGGLSYQMTSSAKPATWKLYILNAPGQDVDIQFHQSHGSVIASDQEGDGYAVDTMLSSNTVYGEQATYSDAHSTSESYTINHKPAAMLTPRWVDEKTIFWEFKGNTENWKNWRMTDIYIKVPSNQKLLLGESSFIKDPRREVDGELIPSSCIVYKQNGQWNIFGSSKTEVNQDTPVTIQDNKPGTTLDDSDGTIYHLGGNAPTDMGGYSSYGSLTPYDGQRVVFGFFTEVKDSSYTVSDFKCEAELVSRNSDMTEWGSSTATFCPFHLKASGSASNPRMYKSHTAAETKTDSDDTAMIEDSWTVASTVSGSTQKTWSNGKLLGWDTVYEGFYSGIWSLHDDMTWATAKDKDGNTIGVNPAQYVKLTELKVSSTGPGTNGDFFQVGKDKLEEIAASDSKSETFNTANGLKVTLTYKGSMEDGFDISIPGIKNSYQMMARYKTEFDQKGFCDAAEEATGTANAVYNVILRNGAGTGTWTSAGNDPVYDYAKRKVVASLSINKAVENVPVLNEDHGGYAGKYSLTSLVGYSDTSYVTMKDYLMSYKDSGDTGSSAKDYDESDAEAMKALVKALEIKDLTITAKTPGQKEAKIYSGGVKNGKWEGTDESGWNTGFQLTPADSTHPGELFQIKVTREDGKKVKAGTEIRIEYTLAFSEDSGFRGSEWYHGGTLSITNGGSATIPYTETSAQTMKTMSPAKVQSVYGKNASVSRAARSGEIDLTVDSGAGVKADYLAGQIVDKIKTGDSSNNRSSWLVYDWTGTKGKDDVLVRLQDQSHYNLKDFSYTDSKTGKKVELNKLTNDAEKSEIQNKVTYLLEKYSSYTNLKVYYTDTKPDGKNLKESELLYHSDEVFKSSEEEKVIRDKVTGADGKEHEILIITNPLEEGGTAGLTLQVDKLAQNQYLAMTYDVDMDWEGFYKEIQDIYPDCKLSTELRNKAGNGHSSEKEQVGNRIEIMEDGISKAKTMEDYGSGVAGWTVTANTGYSTVKKFTIHDHISVKTDDERIQKAAEAALYIDPDSITIKKGNKVIYENGKVQDDGWKDGNIAIKTEGVNLTVTLKNTEDNTVLDAGQSYSLYYISRLDRDKYLQNGGKASDKAKLENSALMERGDKQESASADARFEPIIPVSAEKKYIGLVGSTGNDTAEAKYELTAGTGFAARKNFTISDTPVAKDDKAAQKALHIQDFKVTVKTGSDEAKTYTKDNLPEGARLNLEANSFELAFDSLPKNTTVKITYTVKLDREEYLAAGGSEGTKIDLSNTMNVSSDDGYKASDSADSSLEVKKTFIKEGKVSEKKAENGNPIITWDFDVDLRTVYSDAELKKFSEITVLDVLNPVLIPDLAGMKLLDAYGEELPGDAYKAEWNGTSVVITILEPSRFPVFHLTLDTECGASVDSLSNRAELKVDGKVVKDAKTDDMGSLEAVHQYGYIKSMRVPEFTPVAYKYLDGELCSKAGLFQFTITQVDADGNKIENGYEDTAKNDADGKVTFRRISYVKQPVVGTYFYQVRETSVVKPYEYKLDTRVFTIQVDVQKGDSGYLMTSRVTSPEGYDQVRFDNSTVKTYDFTVTKKWKGDNDNNRPESITVRLMNHGEAYGDEVVLNEANNWTYTWNDLPTAGTNYSAEEVAVKGYTGSATTADWKTTLTNTATNEKVELPVVKKWNDKDDQDGVRPDSVKFHLYADGKDTGKTLTLNEKTNWEGAFKDLDKYTKGHEVKYIIKEESVKGYESTTSDLTEKGYEVTNSHEVEKTSVEGTKTWSDDNNNDGKRPDHITVRLYQNGTEVDSKEVTAADNWKYKWDNLDKYSNHGTENVYTVTEDAVQDYVAQTNGYDLINIHAPDKTSIFVVKKWDDGGNADKIQPKKVEVKLLADGQDTGKMLTLTEKNNWAGVFSNLAMYKDGKKIQYIIQENAVDGYTSKVSGSAEKGFVITNIHKPKKPVKPTKPSNPGTPGTPGTGDMNPVALWTLMLILAAGALMPVLRKKREEA